MVVAVDNATSTTGDEAELADAFAKAACTGVDPCEKPPTVVSITSSRRRRLSDAAVTYQVTIVKYQANTATDKVADAATINTGVLASALGVDEAEVEVLSTDIMQMVLKISYQLTTTDEAEADAAAFEETVQKDVAEALDVAPEDVQVEVSALLLPPPSPPSPPPPTPPDKEEPDGDDDDEYRPWYDWSQAQRLGATIGGSVGVCLCLSCIGVCYFKKMRKPSRSSWSSSVKAEQRQGLSLGGMGSSVVSQTL